MTARKEPGLVLTLSKPAWVALLATSLSVVTAIGAFTVRVSADIREAQAGVAALDKTLNKLETRLERLETSLIISTLGPSVPIKPHHQLTSEK